MTAASAASTRMSEWLDELTECSICKQTFTDPKILPCVHTFCLTCLQTYGNDNIPGDQLACPLCRTNFTVPSAGFEGLPNNYFVNKFLIINRMSLEEPKQVMFCPLCPEDKGLVATLFCLECQEHLCENCGHGHKKLRLNKGSSSYK